MSIIIPRKLTHSLSSSFINYSMSVIISRALPDVRDGLKPSHRRLMFAMHQLGCSSSAKYKKSARIVGDVIGKYHPHGDKAAYDVLVRLAQPYSVNAILVDGQGNFGSIDGDSPAAMRYTESRMSKVGDSCFTDIDKDTVPFEPNYDGTESMPALLPVRFPQLLVNGSSGIAVGMATDIPAHHPVEALNCVSYMLQCELDGKEPSISELMKIMPAPDMPTGGIVHGLESMQNVWEHGVGGYHVMSKWHHEFTAKEKDMVVITEIPYLVKKAVLIETLLELTKRNKDGFARVEGVDSIRDESDKDIRICIEINRNFDYQLVMNELASISDLNKSFKYNIVAIQNNAPKTLGIKSVLEEFISFRKDVVERRTKYLLAKDEQRLHLLQGLVKIMDGDLMGKVIEIVRGASNNLKAKCALCEFLDIEEEQAQVILDMRLQRLVSTEREALFGRVNTLRENISGYQFILSSPENIISVIMDETLEEIENFKNFHIPTDKKKTKIFASRRSEFQYEKISITMADLTPREDSLIMATENGFLRRVPMSEIRERNRGTLGKGLINLREGDAVSRSVECHSHSNLMFVTDNGKVLTIPAYMVSINARGRHINNVLGLKDDENVVYFCGVDFDDVESKEVLICTKNGTIKRTDLSEYVNSQRKLGLIGISLRDGDTVVSVSVIDPSVHKNVFIATDQNRMVTFSVEQITKCSRTSMGVRGIRLTDEASVLSMGGFSSESVFACVSSTGLLKLTHSNMYRISNRGIRGVLVMRLDEGVSLQSVAAVSSTSDMITVTDSGIVNRVSLSDFTNRGRMAKGMILTRVRDEDKMVSVIEFTGSTDDIDSDESITVENDDFDGSSQEDQFHDNDVTAQD